MPVNHEPADRPYAGGDREVGRDGYGHLSCGYYGWHVRTSVSYTHLDVYKRQLLELV